MSQGLHSTEQIRIRKALSAILHASVWAYALIAVVSSFAAPAGKFDDAIPLVHGTLIQNGSIPNLDFYSFYPPLGLYLYAAAFRVLGQTIVAPRAVAGVLFVIVLLLVEWLFRSRFRSEPLVPAAVLLVAVTAGTAIPLPSWPGFAIAIAALLLYLCARQEGRQSFLLVGLSGVVAAAAILCRINFGGYAVFVITLDLLRRSLLDGIVGLRSRLKSEAPMMVAFGLPLVFCCVGLCLWIYGRKVDIALSQFVVLAQRFMALRGFLDLRLDVVAAVTFPFLWFFVRLLKGSESFVMRAVVPAVLGAGVTILVIGGGRSPTIVPIVFAVDVALVLLMHVFVRRLDAIELSFLLFYCCMVHYYISRADFAHLRFLPIAGVLLMPFLLFASVNPTKGHFDTSTPPGTALSVLVATIFFIAAIPQYRPGLSTLPKGLVLISNVLQDRSATDSDRMLGAPPPQSPWHDVYQDKGELEALRYFRERTTSSTPLFVGYRDHSTIFWNDLRMYWLSGRPIAARMFQLEARMATEEPIQREIIDDLEKRKNAWVILDTEFVWDEASKKANYRGSSLLDDYIGRNFKQVASFGTYWVFTRATD